jgi:hypothetical protein
MFGQTVAARANKVPTGDRCFRFEISGLRQNSETGQLAQPIRSSGSIFLTVPFNRMNDEIRRITRMGGRIVNIQPLNRS